MLHPAPEVMARPATSAELPRGAASLVKKADAAGWEHRATYARGTDIGKKALPVVDSVMVKLSRPPLRAVAVWHDGAFFTGYAWVEGLSPKAHGFRQIAVLVSA